MSKRAVAAQPDRQKPNAHDPWSWKTPNSRTAAPETRHGSHAARHARAAQPRRLAAVPARGWPGLAPRRRLRSRWPVAGSSGPSPRDMYATDRHRRDRGPRAHGGGGSAARKSAPLSPMLLCFVGTIVLLANACLTLFPKEKGSCLGSLWRISLTPGAHTPTPKPQRVKYELHTLPVDAKAVTDGDTITVYVDTADHPESCNVPQEVHRVATEWAEAWAAKNYQRADALQKIILDAGYRQLPNSRGDQVIAKKYRIRLRGIDAPESSMPYGKEAKEELVKLVHGKRLKISIYDRDRYGRFLGDVDCDGVFVQEHMLRKGLAWHYTAYDKRMELTKWESQAMAGRMGLWALPNPKKPWEWRKENLMRTV